MSALPALQGVNGPVGGTRTVGVGVGDGLRLGVAEGEEVTEADGLVIAEGLGVGAASAGLEKRARAKDAEAAMAPEILK